MAIPDKVLTNFDLEKTLDTSDEWIRTRTGIQIRHIAKEDEYNSHFASEAARAALKDAGLGPDEVDMIIVATVSGDKVFPATANYVQGNIDAINAVTFDLNAACSGFIYALLTAESYIASGLYNHIVVIGSEIMSRLVDWEDRNTCVLFGDGAGAIVLGPVDDDSGIISRFMKSDGGLAYLLHQPAGGTNLPPSHKTVDERLHFVKMAGNEVFKHAVRCMGDSALFALEQAGLSQAELTMMIPHQANIRIIEATARRINLPMEKVYVNIHNYGNTTAASIPLAFHEARDKGLLKQGDTVLFVAFGGGFTWGSALIKL